jgi:hypothetical protein
MTLLGLKVQKYVMNGGMENGENYSNMMMLM